MILLRDLDSNAPRVAVLGVGLIGSTLVDTLRRESTLKISEMPLSWADVSSQDAQLSALEKELTVPGEGPVTNPRLDIVWSAGSAGFQSTEAQTSNELDSFRRTLAMVERIAHIRGDLVVGFHMMSSAGGLYEGQRLVNGDSLPDPKRPYGELKRAQEEALFASEAPVTVHVYRLTSVYGYIRPQFRRGLIPTLILNGTCQRVSHIFARPSTLRDFIWVEDVAEYVARCILDGTGSDDETAILASGKPTSVREIQNIVERVINRQMYVSYSLEPPNSEDITFATGVLPSRWHSSNLALTVRRIYEDALRRGVTSTMAVPVARGPGERKGRGSVVSVPRPRTRKQSD